MFLGIDVGTSSVKAILIDDAQTILAQGHASLTVERPHVGWSEQDPASWIIACQTAIEGIRAAAPQAWAQLKAIGVSGHMHGAVLLDATDTPLRPCILWNDMRSSVECTELEAKADFRGIGGNIVMPGFTAPKLAWVAKHEPEVFARIAKVLLPKDYVGLWLTGDHVGDMSDAAGTLWLDVANRKWSEPLLKATGLSQDQMPRLVEGAEMAGALRGALAKEWGVGSVVVAGGAGDNAATACGLGVTEPGAGFLSLGTSGVLFATTQKFAPNTEGAVHAFCHAVPDTWHQMGVILSATDSLNWLSEIASRPVAELAAMVPHKPAAPSDALFLPYLSGERTPHNAPFAKAGFFDLTRRTTMPDMVQAVMEGVAFAFADCKRVLEAAGTQIDHVYLAGGGSRSDAWLNIIASATGLTLLKPADGDAGAALGAARLGMAACQSLTHPEIFRTPKVDKAFEPETALRDAYQERYLAYQNAYQRDN